jgi:hypothetical protein
MSTVKSPVRKRTPELIRLLSKLEQIGNKASESNQEPRKDLLLTNAVGLRCENPPLSLVELVVAELALVGNRYCHLADASSSYVQTLREPEGNVLERRLYGGGGDTDYVHLRAHYPGEDSDFIAEEDVHAAFRSFYAGGDGSAWLDWRPLNL